MQAARVCGSALYSGWSADCLEKWNGNESMSIIAVYPPQIQAVHSQRE
jgi:hypothetical protein